MSGKPQEEPSPLPASRPPARSDAPLIAHGDFAVRADRAVALSILAAQAKTRVPELVPIRYGRMLVSPFTFFRGAAAVMAADLSGLPSSGLVAQLCGDAHLSNFGLFASPERRLMFDLNDFDETHPGPFEWDVKRLVTSLVVAARDNGFPVKRQRQIAFAAARRYQVAMSQFARMSELEVWYSRADIDEVRDVVKAGLTKDRRKRLDKQTAKARTRDSLQAYARLTAKVDGDVCLASDPPLMVPIRELLSGRDRAELTDQIKALLAGYARTLAHDRRQLLSRFEVVDMARKVVGVGSVGTRCWIVLLRGAYAGDPLFLQAKEAQPSVLAPFVSGRGPLPVYRHQGARVVWGQRLMQATSDIFLGWQSADGIDGQRRDFYLRQLRDWKLSPLIDGFVPNEMQIWGEMCAWALARAHARSGQRGRIADYLGDQDVFPDAIVEFAERYSDQTEADHAMLVRAVDAGDVVAARDL